MNFSIRWTVLIILLFLAACGNRVTEKINNSRKDTLSVKESKAIITFDEKYHDMGKIAPGEIISYAFKFSNSGKGNLIIKKVSTSCGCTISKWPKKPLHPGDTGEIEVIFDSSGRYGIQNKAISVHSNAENGKQLLTISATISE